MVVDNTEQIKKLIDNCGPGEFYMLNILHRGKDGKTPYEPADKKISQQMIKTFYVSSPEYLDNKMQEIKDLCKMYNARAVINLNKKSWKTVGLTSISILAQALGREGYEDKWWKNVKSVIDSACGQTGACDGNKTWVIDIDTKNPDEIHKFVEIIDQCEPLGQDKIVDTIPTVHGYHLISKPFNKQRFKTLFKEAFPDIVDDPVKDNNPTILYAETKD